MNSVELMSPLRNDTTPGDKLQENVARSSLAFLLESLNNLSTEETISEECHQMIQRMRGVVVNLMDMKELKIDRDHTILAEEEKVTTLNPRNEEFVKKLTSLINDHMTEEKLDIEFMTRHFNMSHSTFYRKVKELTGYTAVDFIRRMKLQRGIELLKTHAYRISEVSYMTGFNSPAHFRQACKDEFHRTPSQILKD